MQHCDIFIFLDRLLSHDVRVNISMGVILILILIFNGIVITGDYGACVMQISY